ncbi:MAG: ribosome biogenesis GTPase Der, partial [Chloroflexi bacterium]
MLDADGHAHRSEGADRSARIDRTGPGLTPAMAKATAAIVGRPNVGKSTLFNRLVGERVAIVEDVPGTTRDRIYATTEWRGREFSLIDTGGLDDGKAGEMEAAVRRQAEAAIREADAVLFVVDAQSGILPVEHDVADLLRRSGKPVLLVANKADSWRGEAQAAEVYELGLGEPLTVSAIQGIGTGDLLDAVVERLPVDEGEEETTDARVAIIGRPNVGKSSFLNALVGSERAVVSEIPGTTRDTIDTAVAFEGRRVILIDTAGIRRRGRIEEGIEKYALLRTAQALERADVAILLTDATEGITAQDVHIAGYAIDAAVGIVLAVNKWDVVDRGPEMTEAVEANIAREFHFAPWMGHRFVSAKTGRNVRETLADALAVVDERRKRVPT